jgi:hypothetical protein
MASAPDGDGDCSDGKVSRTLKVGQSYVDGHFRRREMALDAEKRLGFFTELGYGSISVLSLKSLGLANTATVGGPRQPSSRQAASRRTTETPEKPFPSSPE